MDKLARRLFPVLFFGSLLLLSCTARAASWWDKEWTIRKKITVDTSADGAPITGAIGTTPVLVRLHDGNFQFAAAKDDGGDIRFVAADDKTLLKYHIESLDSLLDEAFVWVSVPDVKPGEKASFWMYYGNAGPKAVKADDPKGTYDADTALVYHFAEKNAPPIDSSGGANNAQTPGLSADGSQIGSGLRIDGKSIVTIPATPSLQWAAGQPMTWSAWIKPGVPLKPNEVLFSRHDGAAAFVIGVDSGTPFAEITDASGTRRTPAAAPMTVSTWHHLAVVSDGTKTTVYLDGDSYAELQAPLPALNGPLMLGGDSADAGGGRPNFTGEADELEISKVARPPGFLKFAATSQAGDKGTDKLVAIGDDEQAAGSWLSTGYFGIIIKSLTLDGWVVIGILAIMSCVSWFVMFSKLSYLNSISKGNATFMKEWARLASDLTVLDHGNAEKVKTLGGRVSPAMQKVMRRASVYRIYHIGAEEIRHRLAGDPWGGGVKFLSVRSIQAIRASLDGGLVRETQKLNSLMVILTISISGGPFLGLLGTVVGVMITFAAIAAAGDVNVNAIAPGIAAALVATVAGLAVAIPALFGYNYLLGRIKETVSDMHVFIDEFVTRMAEFYGGTVYSAEESTEHASPGR